MADGWLSRLFGSRPGSNRLETERTDGVDDEPDLLTDPRFTSSRERLGCSQLAERLAEIETLMDRARDDGEHGPAIVAFFAAWVREPGPLAQDDPHDEEGFELDTALRADVQAVVTALARRFPWEPSAGERELDLGGAYLGRAQLAGADLVGADLREVDLRQADLRDADVSSARLALGDLGGADLRGAQLADAELMHTYFTAADLRGANLQRTRARALDLRDADASGADFSGADLTRAKFKRTNLYGADLSGAQGIEESELKTCFLDGETGRPDGFSEEEWATIVARSPRRGGA